MRFPQHILESAAPNTNLTAPGWMLANGMPGAILAIWPKFMRDVSTIVSDYDTESSEGTKPANDDIVARLRAALIKHKVALAVNTSNLRRSRIGGSQVGAYSAVEIHVRLRCIAKDGSWIALEADGEAWDSSDKGVEKAIASAVQNALRSGLMLDAATPEPAPDANRAKPMAATLSPAAKAAIERIEAATSLDAIGKLMQAREWSTLPFPEQSTIVNVAVNAWMKLCRKMPDGPDSWPEATVNIPLARRRPADR